MKKFEKDEKDIYKIDTKDKLDLKRVLLTILAIVVIILVIIAIVIAITNAIKNRQKEKQQVQEAYSQVIETNKNEQLEREEEKKKQEEEQAKKEKLPQLTEIGKENITHIYSSDKKRAFLTFDDGPSSQTESILNILKEQNIKATFFVLGSRVEAMPEMVKKIYDEGHYIANHGYSHKYSEIYASPQSVLDEYTRCNDAVRNAIGEPEYNSHLFRFPGGLAGGSYAEIKQQAKELLNQNNVVNVDWNALNGDTEIQKPTREIELQRIKETTENKNSVVILMHDTPAKHVTVEALPQIIQYLKEQGYEFDNFYSIIE